MAIIETYDREFAKYWTLNYMAISGYYHARLALDSGQKDQSIQILEKSFQYHEFEKINRLHKKLTWQ